MSLLFVKFHKLEEKKEHETLLTTILAASFKVLSLVDCPDEMILATFEKFFSATSWRPSEDVE